MRAHFGLFAARALTRSLSLHQRIKQLETLQQDCVYLNFCLRGCIQVNEPLICSNETDFDSLRFLF